MKNEPKEIMKDEILIIRMFRGEYLSDNIGHEIINLFKADDGNNYIYVNPAGDCDKKHIGRIGTVLLVRNYANRTFEVLAKATDLEPFFDRSVRTHQENLDMKKTEVREALKALESQEAEKALRAQTTKYARKVLGIMSKLKARKEMKDSQKKKCADIRYGGIPIWDIFTQDNRDPNQVIVVSFKARTYQRAKKRILLTETDRTAEEGEYVISLLNPPPKKKQVHLPKQSLTAYYAENDDKTGYVYNLLQDAIGNPELWEKENTAQLVTDEQPQDEHDNFLKLIRKEDDELCFSNMLAHFLGKDFGLYPLFAKEVLGLNATGNTCSILREKDNINLLIDDGINRIIIENKIHSLVNGLKGEQDEQIESQLSKYWKSENKNIEDAAKAGFSTRNLSAFLFLPEYHKGRICLDKFKEGKQYKIITYKALYDFFSTQEIQAPYYRDFCNALYKHTLEVQEDLYQENLVKFLAVINSLRQQ